MTDVAARRGFKTVAWTFFAVLLALGALALAFRNLDIGRLPQVLRDADLIWIIALGVSIPLEQLIRGWKWRQILYDLRPIATLRLFGAVMAGYLANMLVPVGLSPLVRAWLVARLEDMSVPTVLLTTAVERFVDGIVFAILVGLLITVATLPSVDGNLWLGLIAAGGGSLVLFTGLFGVMFLYKDRLTQPSTFIGSCVTSMEQTFGGRLAGLGDAMSEGIIWPESSWRGAGVVMASFAMKLVSTGHFLWAGLAVGILLSPSDYLFIMVFTGFALIVSRFIRIPGGGVIGSAFALKLLGVADEEALTMVLLVHSSSSPGSVRSPCGRAA